MRNTIRTPRHTRACFAARASSCWDFVVFVVVGGGMTMKQYCSLLEREKDRVGISLELVVFAFAFHAAKSST